MVRNDLREAEEQEAFDMLIAAIAGEKVKCPACKGVGCDRCPNTGEMKVEFRNEELCKEVIDLLMDASARRACETEGEA